MNETENLNNIPETTEESEKKTLLGIRILKIIGTVLTVLLGALAALICCSVFWVLKTWNNLTMEELVFHLKSPLEGTNSGMVWDFVYSCAVPALVAGIILSVLFVVFRKKKLPYLIALLATVMLSAGTIYFSILHLWNTLDVSTYSSNQSTYSTFLDDNYVDPKSVDFSFPEEKRNLIYIYLESVETTYADEENGGAFDVNYIPELTDLALENEDFSGESSLLNGGVSLQGTGWTVAAMFAQTSGLPLLIPIGSNEMNTQAEFFPGVTALGDILDSAGYEQGLVIGSDGEFGGRKLYFESHGDYTIWDYHYFHDNGYIPEGYRVFWGFEDKYLFDFAKEKITDMSKGDAPFNLTLLTVDTHFEDGYLCTDCPDTYGDDQYANAIACSSKKVDELVKWIQEQDFYENTTIILSGDHPTMDTDFCIDVSPDYQRKVFTTYINAPTRPETDTYRSYSTFDAFPTTLASLGVEIQGDRLGLGTNLFSDNQTLSERFGNSTINNELSKKSHLMEELTSTISEEQLHIYQQKLAPKVTADISTTPYDFRTGKFEILVENFWSELDIQAVRCAVWQKEDQSDLQWYEAEKIDDATYSLDVRAADFFFSTGEYKIHSYALDSSGDMIMIGENVGYITE